MNAIWPGIGLTDDPDAWRGFYTAGVLSRKATATVERTRAPSMSAQMRDAMKTGPKTASELGRSADTVSRNVGEILRYDLDKGRVMRLGTKPLRYALADGVQQ